MLDKLDNFIENVVNNKWLDSRKKQLEELDRYTPVVDNYIQLCFEAITRDDAQDLINSLNQIQSEWTQAKNKNNSKIYKWHPIFRNFIDGLQIDNKFTFLV